MDQLRRGAACRSVEDPEYPVGCCERGMMRGGFVQWLTEREIAEGKIPRNAKYRLPTDEEWSRAVGLPSEKGDTPAEKNEKNQTDFPWGTDFPPPRRGWGTHGDWNSWHETKFPLAGKMAGSVTRMLAMSPRRRSEVFRPIGTDSTTWVATSGNGAKIGWTKHDEGACAAGCGAQNVWPRRKSFLCFVPRGNAPVGVRFAAPWSFRCVLGTFDPALGKSTGIGSSRGRRTDHGQRTHQRRPVPAYPGTSASTACRVGENLSQQPRLRDRHQWLGQRWLPGQLRRRHGHSFTMPMRTSPPAWKRRGLQNSRRHLR